MTRNRRKITFSNGTVFTGNGFGADVQAIGPVAFNTAMVGYQEILSTPASYGQLLVMTYPLIGNYGLADEDYESRLCPCGGLIVREYNDIPSNYRYTKTLQDMMEDCNIPGICDVDTRQITQMLRREGHITGLISAETLPQDEALHQLSHLVEPDNLVEKVSCKKLWYARTANFRYNVVALDLGIKNSLIKKLNTKGCNVTVVPYTTTPEEIMALRPDGLLISDGPGRPHGLTKVIALVKQLQGSLPLFAIDLGHQLLALANGATVVSMHSGHHGGNHPVKNLLTGKIEFTAQSHQEVVEKSTFPKSSLHITHVNILDQSVEGLMDDARRILSLQYHPESAPGPQDSGYWFDQFVAYMDQFKQERGALHA